MFKILGGKERTFDSPKAVIIAGVNVGCFAFFSCVQLTLYSYLEIKGSDRPGDAMISVTQAGVRQAWGFLAVSVGFSHENAERDRLRSDVVCIPEVRHPVQWYRRVCRLDFTGQKTNMKLW